MRLKRLTVRGFKSFADKTNFDFESDLTGIVGPNGCGKSNVVDALKWVLGDQRARSLRGKEMTDVIFKGADGREGAHQAEVEITLQDGENDRLGGRTEMTVGRRLTKDKESHYLVNGEPVRLKDVRDLLMDTGLGVGAYSVMEQGRIDAVLSANPEERRAIFEEAAGISRFKLQKRETLRKLDRTEQNLARVQDLLEERQRRIRSLKIQAGRARRYQQLRGELRDLRTAVAMVEGREIRGSEAVVGRKLEDLHTEHSRLGDSEREATARQVAAEKGIEELVDQQQEHQGKVHDCVGRRQALEQQAQGLDMRADELAADAAMAEHKKVELEGQYSDKLGALEGARKRIVELEQELVALGKELEGRQGDVKACQAKVRELQSEREGHRGRLLELIHDRTRLRNAAHDLEAQIEAREMRLRNIATRQVERDAEADGLEQEIAKLESTLDDRQRRLGELECEERCALQELETADTESAGLLAKESQLRQELSEIQGRLQVLRDMESHLEGLDKGPRYVLEQRPEGLRGRLSDMLEIDLEYGSALEAALGPYVQALVIDTREHADAIVRRLAEEQQGRALLLIESEFGMDLFTDRPMQLPEGAVPLERHVSYPANARGLVQWLLRGVVLVESLADADPHRPDLCFVTRDGGLMCGPRLEGGSREGQKGLIVRKARIQVLDEDARKLQRKLEELSAGKQAAAARVERLKDEVREVGLERQSERESFQVEKGRCERRLERLVEIERELLSQRLETEELDAQRRTAQASLGDQLLGVVLARKREQGVSKAEQEVNNNLERAQARAAAMSRDENEVQVRQATRRSERQAARDAIQMHEQGLRELQQNTKELAERAARAAGTAEKARQDSGKCREEATVLQSELEGLQLDSNLLAERLTAARAKLEEARGEVSQVQRRAGDLTEAMTEARLELSTLEHRFARMEERLLEEVGVSLRRRLGEVQGFGLVQRPVFGPCLPLGHEARSSDFEVLGPPLPPAMLEPELLLQHLWEAEDFEPVQAKKQAQVVQSQIDRLGAVNLAAVEELSDEQGNLVLTEQEVEDLISARKSLIEALRRMEEESRSLFETTFQEARGNFQELFRKLFQGGKADMYLQDGEDTLEGGIEIMARPPGKQLQSINLLSGGERTLTALAILFAVFKVKPSPFCILDEVDAALDDTNVERFLRVLRSFVGPTQFCIVTHHKRTMAECQLLYGITMQRRGVSSRIAVNLDEVDELTPDGLPEERNGEERISPGRVEGPADRPADRPPEDRGVDPALRTRIAGEEPVGF